MKNVRRLLICLCLACILWGVSGVTAVCAAGTVKLEEVDYTKGFVIQPHGSVTYEFAEDWWSASEVYISIKQIPVEIQKGCCYFVAYLPKEVPDGQYGLEIFANGFDFGKGIQFGLEKGKIVYNGSEKVTWTKTEEGYLISFGTEYEFAEKRDNYEVVLKFHSEKRVKSEYIIFNELWFDDEVTGTKKVELSDNSINISARQYSGTFTVASSRCDGIVFGVPRVMEVGEEEQLGFVRDRKNYKFVSSDSKIAAISEQGMITAKATGKVQITVTDKVSGESETLKINVVKKVEDKLFTDSIAVSTYNNKGTAYRNWWDESELCIYLSELPVKLLRGGYGVSVYIPDYLLKDGQYGVGVSLCKIKSPYEYFSYADANLNIVNGIMDEASVSGAVVRRIENGYLLDLAGCYAQSEVIENPVIVLKIHSDVTGENGKIHFGDIFFGDAVTGYEEIDLSDETLSISAERLSTGENIKTEIINNDAGLQFTQATGLIYTGETFTLKVKDSAKKKLTYTSSDKKVATVSKAGKITAKAAGEVKITVKDSVSGAENVLYVLVKDPYIRPQTERSTMLKGAVYTFTGVGYGLKKTTFEWSSSNKKVATIGKTSGEVKAIAVGTTKITLKDTVSGKTYSFSLEVYDVSARELDEYIRIETNGLIGGEMEQKITKLLYEVYPEVFDYFANGKYRKVVCNITNEDGIYTTWIPGSEEVSMFISVSHLEQNPNDVDCITHELIHCAQEYPDVQDQVWLMEGMTDYGRSLFGLYNEEAQWSLPTYQSGQKYTDSYTVTAGFLKYVVDNHNKDMIQILNAQFKQGPCPDSIWVENTGYTIDELWAMYAKQG